MDIEARCIKAECKALFLEEERDEARARVAELEEERDRWKTMYESTEGDMRRWEKELYRAGTGES